MHRPFALITATDEANGIGLQGGLPWYCPEDLSHFATLTKSDTVIMGKSPAHFHPTLSNAIRPPYLAEPS